MNSDADDQLLVEALLRYRPESNPTPIDWQAIEGAVDLKFSVPDRRDLRQALLMLAAREPGDEWEKKNGARVNKELRRLAKHTLTLAERFDDTSAEVGDLLRMAFGQPALALSNVATTLEELASTSGRGRKRKTGDEIFALIVQRVWQRMSEKATRGATYTSYEEEDNGVVAGPTVQVAKELLRAADLSDHLPRVREALKRPLRTRGSDPGTNAEKQSKIQRKVDEFFAPTEISFRIVPEVAKAADPSSRTGSD